MMKINGSCIDFSELNKVCSKSITHINKLAKLSQHTPEIGVKQNVYHIE